MKSICIICLAMATCAGGQVVINEFMAANTQAHPDIVDFGDYPDWIELKNTSAEAVSLDGYFLSDDPSNPLKWPLAPTASIPANGYFLVWADGHDTIPGQSFPRGYWPWRNFTTEGYHASFNLSSGGESVVLTKATDLATTTLVHAASPVPEAPATVAVWKYLADGSDQSTQWRARSFDDSGWSSGPAVLGYGDPWIETTVPYGSSASNKYITTYFRHTFQVADPATVANLALRLLVDDGALVYLNGAEVVRQNLPAGEPNYRTLASLAIGGSDESDYSIYNISPTNLVAGDNVLAVEVHQVAANSSDQGFDVGLEATTFFSAAIVDSVGYGPQLDDVSMGRDPALESSWVSFATATPGAANGGELVTDLRSAGTAVSLSLPSGFYDPPQTVELSAAGGEIRYTLDGGLPRPNSARYADPIGITATTVLRARVFEAGKPPGPVETRTYFIGETPGSVPYVSVVADPQILFGDQIGIYYNQHEPVSSSTYGLRDVYKAKDAPGSLEFFAPGGAPGFRVNGGFRMGGENNWAGNSQRAMNFALRGKYGDEAITYDLFPGSGIPVHTGLTLRDGGDTWAKDMLRDALWPLLAKDHMCADTADYRPSVVFINGAYWGIHNIRARWDDAWFFQNHRADPANVDHLLYGHVDSSSVSLGIEKGNSDDWLDLMNFLNTADLSLPENHAFVESRIDIDSFIDFVVAESYGINTSWPWNLEFWRERKPGAKWRWFLPDMDQTFRASQTGTSILSQMLASERVLVRLKASTPFKHRLAQRFCAHVASTFKPSRIDSLIDGMKTEVDAEIPRHIARWAAKGGMSVSSRNSYIQGVKDFTASRDANVHAEIKSQLSLPASAVDLTLDLNISAGGRVLICGVPVEPGVIRMFPDIPFEIQAAPAPGYRFESWTGATGEEATSLTLTGAAALTANFAVSDETVVGGTLAGDTTLDLPSYALAEDLIVPPGTTLVIGPGVMIRLPAGRNIRVQGALQVLGTAAQPVLFTGRGGASWGGVSFENPTAASGLSHLTIRQATRGYDPLRYPSAISGLNAELVMEHLDIDESEGPIFTRGGSTILRASRLHTPYTGDCINIKFATHAEVTDSVFLGNTSPDTDAIDYDGVAGGIIANNRIYRFQAENSDGVDIGEGCTDLIIEGNQIYYNADKGFSIGQGSTATIRRNLVVGCALGVGVKDSGSVATLDQNTFVDCGAGVAAYEKNFGKGGGIATVRNTIFSKCGSLPVTVDPLSSATVGYSLSDSVILAGTGNLMADPRFVDPVVLNFELLPASPAINAGDPLHAPDPDGSRADIGARYQYAATDYPYTIGNTVVIEEILANSEAASDWIELHNRTTRPIEIGGWFLSDSAADLAKYRIPAGTVIPGGGHLVFYEDLHFGAASVDPGRVTPFAINDVGESLYLTSAVNDQLTDYQSSESFGPSMPGESLGFYYKPSSDTWNFVPLATPTPGAPNSRPRVGPIVISEINYQPAAHADAEYLELLNVSAAPVTLYDPVKDAAWRISDGVEYEFPAGAGAVVMQPGERLVLTKSLAVFNAVFTVPSGTRVSEWTAGRLSNSGEQLQLVRPAGLDSLNVRQFARVDRVNYDSAAPWPSSPAGGGTALAKIVAADYGNDFVNWIAATANPGTGTPGPSFASWASSHGLTDGTSGDGDGDGVPNLIEYALGTDPSRANTGTPVRVTMDGGSLTICHDVNLDSPEAALGLEVSSNLTDWTPVETTPVALDGTRQLRCAVETGAGPRRFYRLVVVGQP